MHPRAVRALKIVEVHNGDRRRGVSANGAVGQIDVVGRIIHQIKGLQTRKLCVVRGNEEVEARGLAVFDKRDGQRIVACNLRGLAGADGDVVVLRQIEFLANHDFDAAVEIGTGRSAGGGGAGRGRLGFTSSG